MKEDFPVRFARWGVAERLREVVKRKGGNKVIAERAGVPLGTLNNYLRGRYDLKLPGFVAIAAACQVSLDWLATGHGPERPVWWDPAMFEGDIPPESIVTGPPMPLGGGTDGVHNHGFVTSRAVVQDAEVAAQITASEVKSHLREPNEMREHQDLVSPPPPINAAYLQQSIEIVKTLDGIRAFDNPNVGERIAAAYNVLAGAKS